MKVGVLVGGLAVLGLLWLRQSSPESASGVGPGTVVTADETIAVDGEEIRIPPIAQSAQLVADWRRRPIPQITRNLFRSDLLTPAPEPVPEPVVGSTEPHGMFWMQLERSLAAQVDRARQRDRLVAELLSDAAVLQIESLMTGSSPRVLISGQHVGLGETVVPGGTTNDGQRPLRVERVDEAGVTLSRDGMRVRIWRDGRRPRLLTSTVEPSLSDGAVRVVGEAG